ncbi:MAG: TonB-dependent receptor [Acidobacteria bacterium]|nr:TonB-dependent receptor [Acidobacteriota bacterium]
MTFIRGSLAFLAVFALLFSVEPASAQGVTTGAITGLVLNTQRAPVAGANVIAIHEPSGTTYESVTRADGRFSIPGMRVGGPYSVTVAYVGGGGPAFAPETKADVMVNLGVGTDLEFAVEPIAVQEEITVTAQADPIFSSTRTGASTSVSRNDIANLPTVSGQIADLTRLTPQATGRSFSGQDNRQNNMTVDGSYFNSPFGLGQGQPGGRTLVAPISLESIEQVQVSVAPFDVRQGNFIGGAVNTVTRSGTNQLSASVYHRMRNEDFVGTEALGLPVNPGTFTFRNTGVWAGAPIVRNRLFVFGNYEDEKKSQPLHTFTANTGGQPVSGNVSRVLASDLTTLSAYLKQNFSYDTGGFENLPAETPAKRYLLRTDYNLNNSNKISFRYSQLDSSDGKLMSGSSSAGLGRTLGIGFLPFEASNYSQLENIKSGVGEWNAVLGNSISNSIIAGYTTNNENRNNPELFPFVDILGSDGTTYASFGTEPFTPNNELLYHTYQFQDNLTKFSNRHSLTFGVTMQRYEAQNSFFNCCKQGAWVYNSFADFYADANGYLANPNRTTSPIVPRRYQVRWMNIPGLDKPLQEINVWNVGGYAQDEWRPRANLTLTAGIRLDVPSFDDTAYPNPAADALIFRDETGSPVQYSSGSLPSAKILWSPRVGFNWDVAGNQQTQVRGGTGVFTGPPLYVWISNQLGNTGVLQGSLLEDNPTTRPFTPDVNRYKPATVTGAPAASYEFDVTDNDFKFPQVLRSNIAVDRRLPWGIVGTAEFVYNKDVNGVYYINANLPAAQSAFTGVDTRPRWVGPACTAPTSGPCVNRINNAAGNQVTATIVMKNQSVGNSWNMSGTLSKALYHGLTLKGSYSYGDGHNTIDPSTTAASSFNLNQHASDPNNPGLGRSQSAQGHRVFVNASYNRSYFGFGATTIAAFWEASPSLNGAGAGIGTTASYVFAGDMNGDGGSGNDLIYIPKNTSEMNFVPFAVGATTFTAEQQAQAFEAYINQDKYLREHRGEYAERGGIWNPLVKRMDLSITQDVFHNIGGKRNGGQFRIDFTNFGNLLNHNWGVSQRLVVPITQQYGAQILTNPGVDAQGRPTYRLATASGQLVSKTFQSQTGLSDVYQFLLSFRYSFN